MIVDCYPEKEEENPESISQIKHKDVRPVWETTDEESLTDGMMKHPDCMFVIYHPYLQHYSYAQAWRSMDDLRNGVSQILLDLRKAGGAAPIDYVGVIVNCAGSSVIQKIVLKEEISIIKHTVNKLD